ncbi:MAG: hypothetical protein EOP11_10445, partial [Proteobacteria bacterium]
MADNVISLKAAPDIRFHTFAGKLGPFAQAKDIELYNHVYLFWESYWKKVMASIQSSLPPTEEFFRQDHVLALIDHAELKPRVVAFICLNHYHLASTAIHHPYFQNFTEPFHGHLRAAQIRSAWTAQFITVNEAYSPKITHVSYASVIFGLLQELYAPLAGPRTALIAVARSDNGSCNTALRFGWQVIGAPITCHPNRR